MEPHDYVKFPELTNAQMDTLELTSPHVQIKDDFRAIVEKVTDGDTVRLSCSFRDFTFPLRFLNIDAPEMNAGGEEAKEWLKGMVEGDEVEIKIDKRNRVGKYGRLLGTVISGGLDMGEAMLSLGYAVPFGMKNEGQPKPLDKMLRLEQWF